MQILAIDSSSLVASAAIVTEEKLLAEYTTDFKKTHSQTLLPMIDAVTSMTGFDLKDLDAIAVAAGPGSFTGLRIGSATAKGLAQALEIPILPVPTVDAMAYHFFGTQMLICPLMDARRDQVYTGLYRFHQDVFETVWPQCAVSAEALAEQINMRKEPVILNGDGVPVQMEYLQAHLQVPFFVAPPHVARQRAGSVGALALFYLRQGKIAPEEAWQHKPEYLRVSQAERERKEKGAGSDEH